MIKCNQKLKRRLLQHLSAALLFLALIPILSQVTEGLPPLPTEFYGRVRDFNQNASVGAIVTAYDSGGNLCGSFTVQTEGVYGLLTCNGDDPESAPDDGAAPGENISFRLNGQFTTISGDSIWSYGSYKIVNITYPVVFCGDAFCDVEYESALICLADCPPFNGTGNTTSNTSAGGGSTGGGSGGGGSTGSGSGGGGGGSTGSSSPSYNDISALENGIEGSECKESWQCKNWSICSPLGLQNRTCTDSNSCGTTEQKPAESQQCTYTPTCSDGIMNGLEEDIDCGGLCKPCIGCKDGLQNCHSGQCEEAIDCGGPCSPCPSCFDGIKNCQNGVCEEGIDCGGPCTKSCPHVQKPAPILVCEREINPFNNQFIIFFIIIFLSIAGLVAYSEYKVNILKRNPKAKGIERARQIYSLRRREMLYSAIILLISILFYLYYYLFVMCSSGTSNMPLILATIILAPIIIYGTIKYLEYDEKKKIARLDSLLNYHETQIKNLVIMENEGILELLKSTKIKLRSLIEDGSLSEELTRLLRNLEAQASLIADNYAHQTLNAETSRDEDRFSTMVKSLASNPKFDSESASNPALKEVASSLESVVKQIDDKKVMFAPSSNQPTK